MRKVHYLLSGWRDAWCLDEKTSSDEECNFPSLHRFFTHKTPLKNEFLKIALKLIHFFTVFVHSSNFHREGCGWRHSKNCEIKWNCTFSPRRTKKRSFQGWKVPEKQKTIYKPCEDFACLQVRDNEWEGRHMWVRCHPAKKGFRFVLLFIYGRFKS